MSEHPSSFGEGLPPMSSSEPSMLDGLLADFASARAEFETSEFDVPGKAGVSVRYVTDVPYEMVAAWRKAALGSDVPELRFGLSLLAFACRGLLTDGEPVTERGEPVTFTSPSLQARLGVSTATDAVRRFYGRDGYVLASYNAVLVAAGYGADVSPTKR